MEAPKGARIDVYDSLSTIGCPVCMEGFELGPSDAGQPTTEARDRLESYFSSLAKYREELPPVCRASVTDVKLWELASCLLDGTVFDIVRELEEIQQLSERSLLNRRIKAVGAHKSQRTEMVRRHGKEVLGCQRRKHDLPVVKARHDAEKRDLEKRLAEELRSVDKKVILELDQIVTEQQATLQQAAVPFFTVTNKPEDIRLQMHVLGFIQKLHSTHGV